VGDDSKDKLDKAHEMGVRDGKAGSTWDPPEKALIVTSTEQDEINDAYKRGFTAGENDRKK
jgi:ribosome modulation factor